MEARRLADPCRCGQSMATRGWRQDEGLLGRSYADMTAAEKKTFRRKAR